MAVVVDTGEQARELNAAIRDRLVADGRVDDTTVTTTRAGERIGVGDRIATRRNDRMLGVANRDAWTVSAVGRRGELHVTLAEVTPAGVALARAGARVLTADYVSAHVELAYASTAHGVQGDTLPAAHVVVGEHTGAAAAYVGMTRGRQANTAHFVAADLAEARAQWLAVFARDRADLGPAHAAELAAAEAARYVPSRAREQVIADLHVAWTAEQNCLDRLGFWQPQRDVLRHVAALEAEHAGELADLASRVRDTATAAEQAHEQVQASTRTLAGDAERIRDSVLERWVGDRDIARAPATTVLAGPGRLGRRRTAVARAREELTDRADRWRPHLPALPTQPAQLARIAVGVDDQSALYRAFDASAGRAAGDNHPDHAPWRAAADAARRAREDARRTLTDARRQLDERCATFGPAAWAADPEARLAELERHLQAASQQLTEARARIARLITEPALRAQPTSRLAHEYDRWRVRHDADRRAARTTAHAPRTGSTRAVHWPRLEQLRHLQTQHAADRSIPR